MAEIVSSKLNRRITRLRWQAPILAFLLVLGHQLLEHTILSQLPHWWHFGTQVLFYGLVGPILAWWALTSLRRAVGETEAAERALRHAHSELSTVNERLAFLMKVNRRLSETEDEEALLEAVLELPLEVVPAVACSLIRFDERKQPLPARHYGSIDPVFLQTWTAHLSDSEVRRQCACCSVRSAENGDSCPLLAAARETFLVSRVFCLELRRGDRLYGILNVYLEDDQHPTENEATLLDTMAQEISIVLESQALHSRELTMLLRLQQVHRLSNLQSELAAVLGHTVEALGVDGGVLLLTDANSVDLREPIEEGVPLGKDLELVRGLAVSAQRSESPLIIHNIEQAEGHGVRSLLATPLRTEEQSLGCLVLWSSDSGNFTRRRSNLVDVVAGQMALLVENQRLYIQGKHQVALDERARLAREIHDGLAQTLGYLKLRTAQVINWLHEGDSQRAEEELGDVRHLLDEAYVDAREAIDGLRLVSGDGAVDQWAEEILTEFELLSGIPIESNPTPDVELPPEAQVQLQRIVQEGLSNIRKHANATKANLEWLLSDSWLTLRITDNGRGFDLDDVPPTARHGLRIMRERADLLEADFQITSQPGQGTEISVVLPMRNVARKMQDD